MIKLILLSAAVSLTQVVIAEDIKTPTTQSKQNSMDISAVNKAHAAIKPTDKNTPFWSKDQTKQAELEKRYKKAIADNPDDKKTYAYLAGLYLTNNKTTKAIDAYQDAITYDSENPKLFAALSIAYLHHAKYDGER